MNSKSMHPTQISLDKTSILMLAVLLGLFTLIKQILLAPAFVTGPGAIPLIVIIFVLMGLMARKASYQDVPSSFTWLLRTLTSLHIVYVALSQSTVSSTIYQDWSPQLSDLETLKWICVGFGVAALFRPAFALVILVYPYLARTTYAAVSDFHISLTDYFVVVELGMLLSLFIIVHSLINRHWNFDKQRASNHYYVVTLFAISIHFSNYLYAAIAKLMLDGGPLHWVLANETVNIVAASYVSGTLPVSHLPEVTAMLILLFSFTWPLSNILVLLSQATCVLALARTRLIALFAGFFDLMHIVIYLTTGIFFWKWIAINVAILIGMRRESALRISSGTFVLCLFASFLAPALFKIPKLGWYDSKWMNHIYLSARTVDGQEYAIPSNYFGSLSINFAQQRLLPRDNRFLPTWTFGTTTESSIYTRSLQDCPDGESLPEIEIAEPDLRRLMNIVSKHHRHVTEAHSGSEYMFNLFPHHIWSNPFENRAFADLDYSTISEYRLNIDAVCVTTDPEQDYQIPVKSQQWTLMNL